MIPSQRTLRNDMGARRITRSVAALMGMVVATAVLSACSVDLVDRAAEFEAESGLEFQDCGEGDNDSCTLPEKDCLSAAWEACSPAKLMWRIGDFEDRSAFYFYIVPTDAGSCQAVIFEHAEAHTSDLYSSSTEKDTRVECAALNFDVRYVSNCVEPLSCGAREFF